ncbi:MAG: hypothetical protein ACXVRK_08335 [Gaiellaceae bacterium]
MKQRASHTNDGPSSTADLAALFEAFAGPPWPAEAPRALKRHALTRRTIMVVGIAAVCLAVFVPGSLALLKQLRETPRQFTNDPNQPANARQIIKRYLRTGHGGLGQPKLTGVRRVILTPTPGGTFGVYDLSFTRGERGIAIISSKTGGVGGLAFGPPLSCPAGWALQAGPSMVEQPGVTPVYVTGRTAERVSSVSVRYRSGQTDHVALANHYFLAWVLPIPPAPGRKRGATPSARIIARDARGRILGELRVSGDGLIPLRPGQSPHGASCG